MAEAAIPNSSGTWKSDIQAWAEKEKKGSSDSPQVTLRQETHLGHTRDQARAKLGWPVRTYSS